ncbi:MAG TPA: papain-like cysteine protease family protein [Gemmataceae bacterium]
MTVRLNGSVGRELRTGRPGTNLRDDVLAVQRLLNAAHDRVGFPRRRIAEDGRAGPQTVAAISNFQRSYFRWADGRVDPGQVTLLYLNTIADGGPLASVPSGRSYAYTVPGRVTPLVQPRGFDYVCWAIVATMMMRWRHGQPLTPEQVTLRAGRRPGGSTPADYFNLYAGNHTLPPEEHATFARALGMTPGGRASTGVDGWLDLLQAHGPLVVVTSVGSQQFHGRVLVGMDGDGTPDGTTFRFIDPADGATHAETFRAFNQRFEQAEADDAERHRPQRAQVWHW